MLIGVDYVAAFGLGAFLGSTTYLVLYALVLQLRKNLTCCTNSEASHEIEYNVGKQPFMVLFLPSMLAGALCAIGQACGLVAAEALQPAITSPIAGTLPGALATLIGAVFYREIRVRMVVLNIAPQVFIILYPLLHGLDTLLTPKYAVNVLASDLGKQFLNE